MKKQIFTLCLVAVATTASGRSAFTVGGNAPLSLATAAPDSLSIVVGETKLTIMEQREPPFSDIFIEELYATSSMIYHHPRTWGSLRERALALYDRLPDEQKFSPTGRQIKMFLQPPTGVANGDRIPDASLPDPDGRMHELSDYVGRGKWIIIDFWASWCSSCIAAMPELREVWEPNRDVLTVIGISLDENLDRWTAAIDKHRVDWVNLSAPGQSEISNEFRVNGIPHAVLISPDGTIADSHFEARGHLRQTLEQRIPNLK